MRKAFWLLALVVAAFAFAGCRHFRRHDETTIINNPTTVTVVPGPGWHCGEDDHAHGRCCHHHDCDKDKKH